MDGTIKLYLIELCENFKVDVSELICEKQYQEIVHSATIKLNNYLHYFEINTRTPDELKLVYFSGITLYEYISNGFKKQVLFEMLSLMKDITQQILSVTENEKISDFVLNRNISKIEHVIYSDQLFQKMGEIGLYIMFRSIINQVLQNDEIQQGVLEKLKINTSKIIASKSENDNIITLDDFENTVGG